MTLTLLFDLDDTLLQTNLDAFIPAYFKALSGALAAQVPPERMLPALRGGMNDMLANSDPSLTLRQVFDAHFFPALGVERSNLQPVIDRFYAEVFPSLAALTRPVSGAVELVDWAFAQGYLVAVATNPIFPLSPIRQRLEWAGLPPEKYLFALISSYETFHFTKEMVAYYPELMAQMGWPDGPVIMVGDDFGREVQPTQAAGFPVYVVTQDGKEDRELGDLPHGPLASLRTWLEKIDQSRLQVTFQTPQALLACLRSTPAALATLTASLEPHTWNDRPQATEWCLTEIICHLRDFEREVNLPRLHKVLSEDNPFIPGEVTDRWVEERHYARQDGRRALVEFTAARKEVIALLAKLGKEWALPTRHAIFGPTSLQELVGFSVDHDRAHVQQIWKTIHGNSQG